jgi:hypothetical protein
MQERMGKQNDGLKPMRETVNTDNIPETVFLRGTLNCTYHSLLRRYIRQKQIYLS